MRGESKVEIGGVARAHGIRGEIVVVTHDRDSDTLGKIPSIYIGGVEHKIAVARDTQRGWLIALEGISTRNDAELLKGKRVEVDRDLLELDEEDVLLDDMVGCNVQLADGTSWGVVFAVDVGEFQDLLVVHAPAPNEDQVIERLLPMIDEYMKSVDVPARLVIVDPPEGLPEMITKKKKKA